MMLRELLEEYLDHLEIEKNRSKKTRENYERYITRFFEWANVSSPRDITEERVRKFRLYLNRVGEEMGAPLKRITQNYYIIALRGFLKYMAKREIETLPAERIELAKVPDREIDFLEHDEIERLLTSPNRATLTGLRDRAILETLFSTGLRVSELCSLNRTVVQPNRHDELTVRGKGGKLRVVFLSDGARSALREYLAKRTDIDDALFVRVLRKSSAPRSHNLRLTPRSIQRIIKKYAAAAGITKDIHTHTLRHSFATDLLRNGADLRSVQALLGHSNITTTQIYTHVTDKQLREVHQAFHARRRKNSR